MAVDGKDFGEEVGGVDQAGEEDKAEKVLAHPLLQPVKTHVYRQKEGDATVGGGQGW